MNKVAFVFDMDGTMVDSMPFHAKSWVEFTRRHRVAMDVDEIMQRTTGRTGIECMREVFGRDLAQDRAQALVDEKEAIYRELFAPVFSEVPGFRGFVAETSRRGLRWGVATAGDRHNIAFVLERLKLPARPQVIVGGDEGLAGKPEPALFLEAARRLRVAPAHCIVFEDAPFGIEAARRAGMRAVAVCTTHPPAELAGPHVVAQVRDYHQLTSKNFWETLDA